MWIVAPATMLYDSRDLSSASCLPEKISRICSTWIPSFSWRACFTANTWFSGSKLNACLRPVKVLMKIYILHKSDEYVMVRCLLSVRWNWRHFLRLRDRKREMLRALRKKLYAVISENSLFCWVIPGCSKNKLPPKKSSTLFRFALFHSAQSQI